MVKRKGEAQEEEEGEKGIGEVGLLKVCLPSGGAVGDSNGVFRKTAFFGLLLGIRATVGVIVREGKLKGVGRMVWLFAWGLRAGERRGSLVLTIALIVCECVRLLVDLLRLR